MADLAFSDSIMCFPCGYLVCSRNYHCHTFFGMLRCELCHYLFRSCSQFCKRSRIFNQSSVTCTHFLLSWVENPCQYLLKKLCSRYASPSAIERELEQYLSSLCNLKKLHPWNDAYLECKKYLNGTLYGIDFRSQDSLPKISFLESTLGTQDTGRTLGTITVSKTMQECDGDVHGTINGNDPESIAAVLRSVAEENNFVLCKEVASQWSTTKLCGYMKQPQKRPEKKRRKKNKFTHVKNRTSHSSSEERSNRTSSCDDLDDPYHYVNCKQNESEDTHELELITPDDPNYLITKEVIEECPMCYTKFKPSCLVFNIETKLIKCYCSGCNLVVFFVIEPPPGCSQNVFIELK